MAKVIRTTGTEDEQDDGFLVSNEEDGETRYYEVDPRGDGVVHVTRTDVAGNELPEQTIPDDVVSTVLEDLGYEHLRTDEVEIRNDDPDDPNVGDTWYRYDLNARRKQMPDGVHDLGDEIPVGDVADMVDVSGAVEIAEHAGEPLGDMEEGEASLRYVLPMGGEGDQPTPMMDEVGIYIVGDMEIADGIFGQNLSMETEVDPRPIIPEGAAAATSFLAGEQDGEETVVVFGHQGMGYHTIEENDVFGPDDPVPIVEQSRVGIGMMTVGLSGGQVHDRWGFLDEDGEELALEDFDVDLEDVRGMKVFDTTDPELFGEMPEPDPLVGAIYFQDGDDESTRVERDVELVSGTLGH